MDDKLKQLAESRYSQKEFLGILFELAVEDSMVRPAAHDPARHG